MNVYVPKLTFQPNVGPRRTPRRQPSAPSSRMLPREGQKRSNPESRNATTEPQRGSNRRSLPQAGNAPSTAPNNVKVSTGTAKQDENLPAKKKMRNVSPSPGAAVIRDLRSQIASLRDELAAMKKQVESGASCTDCQMRPFFTERFHNQGQKRHWTTKRWFGLTNSFPDLVQFVKVFHPDDTLEEEHSPNKRSARMTQFEVSGFVRILSPAFDF